MQQACDPASSAAREGTGLYVAELRHRFDFDDAGLDRRDAVALRPPGGVLVLAVSDGEAVACGGVQTIGAGVGEIKRMWVRETWRGAGFGGRLLRHLEDCARHLGNPVVRLDTGDTLTEAIGLYERTGYHPIDRYNDNPHATRFFEKPLG